MKNRGFTLVEAMVSLLIMAVLTAIAIPSYTQYTIKNAENQAMENLLSLNHRLDSFRARNLTGYDQILPNGQTSEISFVGGEQTAANHLYRVELIPESATWRAIATPNTDNFTLRNGAHSYLIFSTTESCQTQNRTDNIESSKIDCRDLVQWER